MRMVLLTDFVGFIDSHPLDRIGCSGAESKDGVWPTQLLRASTGHIRTVNDPTQACHPIHGCHASASLAFSPVLPDAAAPSQRKF